MQPTPTRAQPLTWLVTTSFALAIIATILQIGIVLTNIDIYLLNQPPLQLIDWQASALRGTATLATAIGVVGTLILFILKRRDKALAAAEKAREDPWNQAGKAADKLKGVPEQISRVRSGLGCLGTYSIAIACISVVTLTVTLTPSQVLSQALGYNGQLSGPAAIPPFIVSTSVTPPIQEQPTLGPTQVPTQIKSALHQFPGTLTISPPQFQSGSSNQYMDATFMVTLNLNDQSYQTWTFPLSGGDGSNVTQFSPLIPGQPETVTITTPSYECQRDDGSDTYQFTVVAMNAQTNEKTAGLNISGPLNC